MPLDTNSAAPRRGKRTPARLQQSLEKNLLAYAAAAGAGLIVYAHPAAAQVVYTPSNISLGTPFAGGVTTNLDLNNDGTPDFKITNFSYQTQGQGGASLTIVPTQPGNEIVGAYAGTLNHRIIAQGLGAGVKIGSSAKFLLLDTMFFWRIFLWVPRRSHQSAVGWPLNSPILGLSSQ
jgi:hypothetical protein